MISALDAAGTSLFLQVDLESPDTVEHFSTHALLDSGATGSFIDHDFVREKGLTTYKLSCPIAVINVNRTANEAGRISKVVDTVLHYCTHSKHVLLAVTSLGKQNLLLG
jgi:hypothetical protein